MNIQGTNRIHGPHGINAPHVSQRAAGPRSAGQTNAADRVDISPAAEAAMAAQSGDIRHDLVNHIREQIAAGTYVTPEKLDIALDRMLDEMA